MANNVAAEIESIRAKLDGVEAERARLHPGARARLEELLTEEHRLTTELTALQDRASRRRTGTAEERAAAQSDITHIPRLTTSEDK